MRRAPRMSPNRTGIEYACVTESLKSQTGCSASQVWLFRPGCNGLIHLTAVSDLLATQSEVRMFVDAVCSGSRPSAQSAPTAAARVLGAAVDGRSVSVEAVPLKAAVGGRISLPRSRYRAAPDPSTATAIPAAQSVGRIARANPDAGIGDGARVGHASARSSSSISKRASSGNGGAFSTPGSGSREIVQSASARSTPASGGSSFAPRSTIACVSDAMRHGSRSGAGPRSKTGEDCMMGRYGGGGPSVPITRMLTGTAGVVTGAISTRGFAFGGIVAIGRYAGGGPIGTAGRSTIASRTGCLPSPGSTADGGGAVAGVALEADWSCAGTEERCTGCGGSRGAELV
jgi:hypothetical protein